MVKGRVRTLNHATFVYLRIRAYTAYGHGAGDRMRPLAPQKRKKKSYFTNLTCFKLISTFTFLLITNVYAVTFVRPI